MSTSRTRGRKSTQPATRNHFIKLAAKVATPGSPSAAMPVSRPAPAAPVTAPDGKPDGKPDGAHEITVTGSGEQWNAACSCGEWATTKPMKRESSVKGAHTKHVKATQQA